MTTEEKNYEPAFPTEFGTYLNGFLKTGVYPGLTKREYFAALAMQGICSGSKVRFSEDLQSIVNDSVEIADKLIERLKNNSR